MLIDTHCHLQDPAFSKDRKEIIESSKDEGIEKLICVGTSFHDNHYVVQLSEKYENVFATVGVYPQNKSKDNLIDELGKLIQSKKVVAIGECGLDFVERMENDKETQKEIFRKQIEASIKFNLPLVIHNRNADKEIIEELEKYKYTGKLKGVFHCFISDDNFFTQKVLDLGFHVSFTAIITYPSLKGITETIKFVPLDRILVETDSPYLPPQAFRGKRCEPKYVKIVAEKIAEVKSISNEEIDAATTKNAQRLFNL